MEDYAAIWYPISFVLDPGFWNPTGAARIDYEQLRIATLAMICRIVTVLLTGRVEKRILSNNIRIRILDSTCSEAEIRPWPSMTSSAGRPDGTTGWEEESPRYPDYKDSPMHQCLWARIEPSEKAAAFAAGESAVPHIQGIGGDIQLDKEGGGVEVGGGIHRVYERQGRQGRGVERGSEMGAGDGEEGVTEREFAGRDGARREFAGREFGGRDASGREFGARDASGREFGAREFGGRDGVGRDGVGRDGVGRDGVGRDGVGRDGVGRDGAGRDGVGRDGAGRDGAGRDGAGRDGALGFVSLEKGGGEASTITGSEVQGLINDVEAQLVNSRR